MINKIILFFVIIILNGNVFAQKENKIIEVAAKVIDGYTNAPVKYANILNIKKGKIVTCDSSGYFRFTILKSDILRVSAIGYTTNYLCFKDSVFDNNKVYKVLLNEKTYELSQIDIFDARWKDLEFELKHKTYETNEIQENLQNWFKANISIQELAMITAAASVGIPIPYTSKREKQLLKVTELEKRDYIEKVINTKFNVARIMKLTGLNEKKAVKFMNFCNFDKSFLFRANDYDIITQINQRLTMYLKTKKSRFN